MPTPAQEAAAQLMFWGSMGSLPLSIALFIVAFQLRPRAAYVSAFAVAGLFLTQFSWYFVYLGVGLATKVGVAHPPSWLYFAPIGFGIALFLLIIAEFLRGCRAPKTGMRSA